MTKVLVTYASDYGNTKKMAESVAAGASSVPGVEAVVKAAEEVTAEDLTQSDGLIFGSPVHMGAMDWRVKKLIDSVCSRLWMKDALSGKVGAVFVTGGGLGSAGGGAELVMLSMLANLAENGLVLAPLPKHTPGYAKGGLHWGPYVRTADESGAPIKPDDALFEAARHHGANVARLAALVSGKKIFAA